MGKPSKKQNNPLNTQQLNATGENEDFDTLPDSITFFARLANFSFSVPVFDDTGKQIPRKREDGTVVMLNGRTMYESSAHSFTAVNGRPGHALCTFVWTPDIHESVLTYLEKLSDDPASPVITEEVFERSKNPDAFDKNREIDDLRTELSDKDKALADALAYIQKIEGGK